MCARVYVVCVCARVLCVFVCECVCVYVCVWACVYVYIWAYTFSKFNFHTLAKLVQIHPHILLFKQNNYHMPPTCMYTKA